LQTSIPPLWHKKQRPAAAGVNFYAATGDVMDLPEHQAAGFIKAKIGVATTEPLRSMESENDSPHVRRDPHQSAAAAGHRRAEMQQPETIKGDQP
jgi:hypothetical protein